MIEENIPLDSIRNIELRNYQHEDKPIQKKMELSIHFKESHSFSDDISNNVLMFKGDIFNSVELRNLLEKLEGGDESE